MFLHQIRSRLVSVIGNLAEPEEPRWSQASAFPRPRSPGK